MFAGLVTLADDEGWTLGDPEDIRRQILPNTRISRAVIEQWLVHLLNAGMLSDGTSDEHQIDALGAADEQQLGIGRVVKYYKLTAFESHQRLSRTRKSRRREEKGREEKTKKNARGASSSGAPFREPEPTTSEQGGVPDPFAVEWLRREFGFGADRARTIAAETGIRARDVPAWDEWRDGRPLPVVVEALKARARPPAEPGSERDSYESRNRDFAEREADRVAKAAPKPDDFRERVGLPSRAAESDSPGSDGSRDASDADAEKSSESGRFTERESE